jgi:hypothetical protein
MSFLIGRVLIVCKNLQFFISLNIHIYISGAGTAYPSGAPEFTPEPRN